MSLLVKALAFVSRTAKKTGVWKGPDLTDLDKEITRARKYNREHPYKEPTDKKARYQTEWIGKYPCLLIRQKENSSGKALLFLHGGGDSDTWSPELPFARNYGKHSNTDVVYPLYPPFTEASPEEAAEFILETYRRTVKRYGKENVAVLGDSYGGLLALQLLTMINRNNRNSEQEQTGMPALLLLNSPFAYPKSEEEWKCGEELEKEDAMLPLGALRYMHGVTTKLYPDTPDYLLYPEDMDFRDAPETYVFYALEACYAAGGAISKSYERDGAKDRLHMHIEKGMIHCYASAPVFKESKRDFNQQITLLKEVGHV